MVAPVAPDRIARFSPFELPSTFSHYRVEREIAAGGMGMVYEAQDTRLNRRVALKMLRQVLFSTAEAKLRFKNEAALASVLDHPNIVPILEIGKSEGQPYLTMKLIRGGNLADRLDSGALPVREAAEWMVLIARAVHFAHQHGVLHRDLKPANILLDEKGAPWLTDFGLAKLLDDNIGNTLTQTIAGTPDYMSPEQAAGRQKEISTATDVWALGVILYQMLTGRLPFRGESPSEILRQVMELEPPRPSTIVRHMDQDLETLCQRCLDKDLQHRLASAGELADELERWLSGEPIHSRRITTIERVGKWVRRNPYRTTMVSMLMLFVLGAATAITWQWKRAEENAERERRTAYSATLAQALAVRENHDFGRARGLLDGIDPELRGFDWRLLNALCRGDEDLAYRLGEGPGAVPECFTLTPDGEHLAIVSADGHLHLRDLQGLEVALRRALPPTSNQASDSHYGLTFSPDGQRLAYGQGDVLRVLDARTLTLLHEEISRSPQFDWLDDHRLLYGFNGSVTAPPYPRAGAWILNFRDVKTSSDDVPRISFPQMCAPLAVAPDRQSFVLHRVAVSESWARTLHVYRNDGDFAELPEALYALPGREYPGILAFSHSGRYLALSTGAELSRTARVLDVVTGGVLFDHQFRFPIVGLAIDPHERQLGLVGEDSSLRVYDFTRGTPEGENANTYDDDVKLVHSQPVSGRGASTPPRNLVSRSAQDGRATFYLGHEKAILGVAFDATGSLVTCSGDGTIRHWPKAPPHPSARLGHIESTHRTLHPVASHDGLQVLYSTHFHFVRLCDVALSRISEHDRTLPVSGRHTPLAMLQDGRAITQDKVTTEAVIWAMQDGQMREQRRLPTHCPNSMHNGGTRNGALSQDEKRLAGVMNGWLFSADLEKETMVWSGPQKASSAFAGHDLSPDGEWIASSDFGTKVTIHPFEFPEKIVATLGGESHHYDTAIAFGRDGRRLYVGNEGGSIHVWDTATWRELPELSWQAHLSAVTAIAVSNDGTLIATSGDTALKLFPIEPEPGESQRRERLSFRLDQAANWIQFACDISGRGDRALLHSVPNGTIEIWETDLEQKKGEPPAVDPAFLPFPLCQHAAVLLPNGKVLVAGGVSIEPVALSACNLYDPDTATWQPTGPMRRPRAAPMLTILPDGKILVAGGRGMDDVPLTGCELYDPDTGIWTPTGSMATPRFQGFCMALKNGTILIVGGFNADGPVNSCEVYDPVTGTWSPTGKLAMASMRSGALLADGSVLAVSGSGDLLNSERYDPASGIWNISGSTMTDSTDSPASTATLLPDGEVLVAGGSGGPTCQLYDSSTGEWKRASPLPHPGDWFSTTLLPSGKVLIAGGKAQVSATTYLSESPTVNTCLLYDSSTGTWSPAPSFSDPRSQHTATLLKSGKVLFVGGRDEKGGPTQSVEVYDAGASEH
ncbi:MAG: protein kinase [Verrucomicrobiales bacterium]